MVARVSRCKLLTPLERRSKTVPNSKLFSVKKPNIPNWTFIGIGIGTCPEDRTFCAMVWLGKYVINLGPHK
jgi:hypothetical protein